MFRNYFSYALRIALSLSIFCPPLTLVAAQSRTQINSHEIDYSKAMKDDPIWDQFVSGQWSAPRMGSYKRNDPLLDNNPYFLRSQRWTTTAPVTTTRVTPRRSSLILQIAQSRNAVEITAPLVPLYENNEFLFFKANSTDVFNDKAADSESYGEGLFFIDKALLAKESFRIGSAARPVPVFYLPVSGTGWTTQIQALEFSDTQVIAFSNAEGESASIDTEDLRALSKIYQNNIVLASISVLRHEIGKLHKDFQLAYQGGLKNYELPFVFPAAGSTALFGVFFTGVNLDQPAHSLPGTYAATPNLWNKLFPTANASDLLTPDVLDRLIIVGKISGTVFVTSILAKYTIFKQRNADRRAYIESEEDKVRRDKGLTPLDRTTRTYKAKREAIEWVDYFAHGLSTISSAVGTAAGYLLEYGADFLWKPDSKINRGVRKFLENTFLYSRRQNENVLVNAQTFFLGVIVLGGIDTTGVVLQLLFVSPIFFPWVAQAFGDQIHSRVTQQFSGDDAAANNIVTSEIMRNLSAYGVSGAYSYSSSQRQKIMEDIKPVIESQMRLEGKNPYDPKNEPELERRAEAIIERMLIERGLPSNKKFLFGSPTMVRAIAHFMGYKTDRRQVGNDDEFILEKARWGLVSHAIKRAQKAAQEVFAKTGNPQSGEAVRILNETKNKFSLFTRMLKRPFSPIANVKEAFEIRKMLTVLSYEGEMLGGAVKYLNIWGGASTDPAATLIAARLFRQALFSLVQNKPYLIQPSTEQLNKFYAQASQEVVARLPQEIEKSDITVTDSEILKLEIVKEKIEEAAHQKGILEWTPKMDWLERSQMERAHLAAMSDVGLSKFAPGPDNAKTEAQIYREAYKKHLARVVGIHELPEDQSDLVRLASEAAATEVESSLKNNEGMARYFSELNDVDQLKFLSHVYATSYLEKYSQMTVSNSSVVTLTSPEQPGVFQRLRQTEAATSKTRLGKLITGTLRTLESPMDNGAFKPGVTAWLKRYVPFWGDFKAGLEMKKKTIIPMMTVGYAVNYYMWQVRFPWDTALFFTATAIFTGVANYWLDRIMINNGIRPMDTTGEKVKYSLLYTWLTYPTYIPFFFFLDDWLKLSQNTQDAVKTAAKTTFEFCQKLLTGG